MGCGAGKEAPKVAPDVPPEAEPDRGSDITDRGSDITEAVPGRSTSRTTGRHTEGKHKKHKVKKSKGKVKAPWEQGLNPNTLDVPNLSMETLKQVPPRIIRLFNEMDTTNGGRVTFDELEAGLTSKFPGLSGYARQELSHMFKKYAFYRKDFIEKTLDLDRFKRLYAEFLFCNFDRNRNGYLDREEAQAAVDYLKGGTTGPLPSKGSDRVDVHWFWKLYLSAMSNMEVELAERPIWDSGNLQDVCEGLLNNPAATLGARAGDAGTLWSPSPL